jgi:hypothetical protein
MMPVGMAAGATILPVRHLVGFSATIDRLSEPDDAWSAR